MTFSIVARCPDSGMFGVAVSSSSPAVAARCAFTRAGVGAVTSQNVTDPTLGPLMLSWLEAELTAREAVQKAAQSTEHRAYRQLTAVDRYGMGFVYTGAQALGRSTGCVAPDVACAGNLLATTDVPEAMVSAFQRTPGHIADRLIAALRGALDAGGEAGPIHSAGLQVVRDVSWPIVDLRVDWSESCPVDELAGAWSVYEPQLEDYVTRALSPAEAPGYGVPGDEASGSEPA